MNSTAVVFDRPRALAVRPLALTRPTPADVVVDVQWSGVSTGTERLLWTGAMPAFSPFYGILPEHTLGTADIKTLTYNPFFKNPTVGMGPFRFVRYETDQFVELEKNPNYRGRVGLDRVFLKPVTTDVATAQQLRRGDGVCWSHPAYANKCVFARSDKELVCASLAAE